MKIEINTFDFRKTNPIQALQSMQHEEWAKHALLGLNCASELSRDSYDFGIYLYLMMYHNDYGMEKNLCYLWPNKHHGNMQINGVQYQLDFCDDTTLDLQQINDYYELITYCFPCEIEAKMLQAW